MAKNLLRQLADVFFAKTLHRLHTTFFKPSKQNQHTPALWTQQKKMSEIMKMENKNNELVLGNKDNTSSHYRIKSERKPVQIGEIVKQCVEQLKMKRYEYQ